MAEERTDADRAIPCLIELACGNQEEAATSLLLMMVMAAKARTRSRRPKNERGFLFSPNQNRWNALMHSSFARNGRVLANMDTGWSISSDSSVFDL